MCWYHCLRMSFGLKVTQDIYQMYRDQIIECCPGAIGIHGDTPVYGKTIENHVKIS